MNLEEEEYYRARILTRLKIIKNNSSQFRITKWHILGAIGLGIFICNFPTWDNTQQLEVRGEIVPTSTMVIVDKNPRLPIKEESIKEEKSLINKSGFLSNPYSEELDKEEIKVLKSYKSPYDSVFPKSPYKGIEKGLKKLETPVVFSKSCTTIQKKPKHIETALISASKKHKINIEKIIVEKSNKYGMDSYLILRQLYEESGFNPNARSAAGACGIAQFVVSTGKSYGLMALKDIFNPEKSIDAAIRKMKEDYLEFKNSKIIYYGRSPHGRLTMYTKKPRSKKYESILINPTKDSVIAYKYALAKYNGGDGGVLYFALRGGNFTCNKRGKFTSYARQTGCYITNILPANYTPNIK